MKERIITALCLIAIVVPAVIFGGIFYKIVIGVAMALSVYEMLHICSRPRIGMYMYIIVGLFFVTGFLFNRNQLLISSYSILVYLAVILACLFWITCVTCFKSCLWLGIFIVISNCDFW